MRHRHLDYASDTPIEQLSSAALVDLLERGDLSDWQPVVAAIAWDPHGELTERVMRLVDRFPMYGTSPLVRAWIERVRVAARPRMAALSAAALRRRAGSTQAQLALRVGMSQSDLSKFERRQDVRISTLRSYVEALGGDLRLVAAMPDALVEIVLAGGGDSPPSVTGSPAWRFCHRPS